ncbi:MAG: hypothetical protein LCH96_07550 [Actinobacteria bacterium]|nr:hypothetical protein [Actinomycetota bacterium]
MTFPWELTTRLEQVSSELAELADEENAWQIRWDRAEDASERHLLRQEHVHANTDARRTRIQGELAHLQILKSLAEHRPESTYDPPDLPAFAMRLDELQDRLADSVLRIFQWVATASSC